MDAFWFADWGCAGWAIPARLAEAALAPVGEVIFKALLKKLLTILQTLLLLLQSRFIKYIILLRITTRVICNPIVHNIQTAGSLCLNTPLSLITRSAIDRKQIPHRSSLIVTRRKLL